MLLAAKHVGTGIMARLTFTSVVERGTGGGRWRRHATTQTLGFREHELDPVLDVHARVDHAGFQLRKLLVGQVFDGEVLLTFHLREDFLSVLDGVVGRVLDSLSRPGPARRHRRPADADRRDGGDEHGRGNAELGVLEPDDALADQGREARDRGDGEDHAQADRDGEAGAQPEQDGVNHD